MINSSLKHFKSVCPPVLHFSDNKFFYEGAGGKQRKMLVVCDQKNVRGQFFFPLFSKNLCHGIFDTKFHLYDKICVQVVLLSSKEIFTAEDHISLCLSSCLSVCLCVDSHYTT